MAYSIDSSPTLPVFPSSTAVADGNISVIPTDTDTVTAADLSTDSSNQIFLLIIVATVPAVLILCIVVTLFIVYKRRQGNKSREPIYSIKVEYPDEEARPQSTARPRWRNSHLDLTINGIHIDLEFPNPADKRQSVRISGPPNMTEAQMKELQMLSKECKENLEWINEVLEREMEPPLYPAGASASEGDRLLSTKQRDSLYSGCSEKEKENYEVSEKLIRRESSKKAAGYVPKVTKRWHNKDRESSPQRESPLAVDRESPCVTTGESPLVPRKSPYTFKADINSENLFEAYGAWLNMEDSCYPGEAEMTSSRKEPDKPEVKTPPFPFLEKESYDPIIFIEDGLQLKEQNLNDIDEVKKTKTEGIANSGAPKKCSKAKCKKSLDKEKAKKQNKSSKKTKAPKTDITKGSEDLELHITHAPDNEVDKDTLGALHHGRRGLDTRNLPCPSTQRKGPKMRFETL